MLDYELDWTGLDWTALHSELHAHTTCPSPQLHPVSFREQLPNVMPTEAESDIPVHVRVHVHEGKISGCGLRYQGVVRVWSQDGGS